MKPLLSIRATAPPIPYLRCDCGKPATRVLPVIILSPSLKTEYVEKLNLCDDCYRLERQVQAGFKIGGNL